MEGSRAFAWINQSVKGASKSYISDDDEVVGFDSDSGKAKPAETKTSRTEKAREGRFDGAFRSMSTKTANLVAGGARHYFFELPAGLVDVFYANNVLERHVHLLHEQAAKCFLPFSKFFFMGLLAGLIVYNLYTQIHTSFISMNPKSGLCSEVPVSVTGIYFMDFKGFWSGYHAFQASRAIYQLHLHDFLHEGNDFTIFMRNTKAIIDREVVDGASFRTLSENLLYWMSWRHEVHDGAFAHDIQLTGSIESVFDRYSYKAFLSDSKGECDVAAQTRYAASFCLTRQGRLSTLLSLNSFFLCPLLFTVLLSPPCLPPSPPLPPSADTTAKAASSASTIPTLPTPPRLSACTFLTPSISSTTVSSTATTSTC